MSSKRWFIRVVLLILVLAALISAFIALRNKFRPNTPEPLSLVYTVAGAPNDAGVAMFEDPFGIATSSDGSIYVTDGEAGKLWKIANNGTITIVGSAFEMPSGVALAADGTLVIAETGSHVITRINPVNGQTEIIAGTRGKAGYSDGAREQSLFNGPIGVAVGRDDVIYVADSYNDRIRAIDKDGNVRTIAGGSDASFVDSGVGADARFHTPCGIALAPDGALIVADTGNNRVRRVELNGATRTIAGTGEKSGDDGLLFSASFNEPIGIAVDTDGTIYVADSRGSALRSCGWDLFPRVNTLLGGLSSGFEDGEITHAKLSRPSGVALAADGTILFVDSGNRLVRAIVGVGRERGVQLKSGALSLLTPTAEQMRGAATARWPYDPPERRREIAATFGEIRGELTESDKQAWFHNGLDIPGTYGETVYAVRSERVRDPLSIDDVGTARERIRLPTIGYIHLRIGRNMNDEVVDESKFIVQRSPKDKVALVRVRRGTKFAAGEQIGTLNNQNHVHLIAGPVGKELNAIAALGLPDIGDKVAPTLESDGVQLFDSKWQELHADAKDNRIIVSNGVRVVVKAYDQMDGNAARRRLGIYRLGYQVLMSNGSPAPGYSDPLLTISFERLPRDENAAYLAYALGSRSGATGETIFKYIVTNLVRDGEAKESFWDTTSFSEGEYLLRVFAEDYFGNRTSRDIAVRVIKSPNP